VDCARGWRRSQLSRYVSSCSTITTLAQAPTLLQLLGPRPPHEACTSRRRLPTAVAAEALYLRGAVLHVDFIMGQGDPERELDCFTRAEIFGQLGDKENAALATAFIGIFHHVDRLDRDTAESILRRAYETAPATGAAIRGSSTPWSDPARARRSKRRTRNTAILIGHPEAGRGLSGLHRSGCAAPTRVWSGLGAPRFRG
jgi:hypothetical protein